MSFAQEFVSRVTENNGGPIVIVIETMVWIGINAICILLVMAVRQWEEDFNILTC